VSYQKQKKSYRKIKRPRALCAPPRAYKGPKSPGLIGLRHPERCI